MFRIPGRSRFAGEHRGRDAGMAYIDAARAASRDHEVTVEVLDALVSEERFALVVVERFARDGEVVEIPPTNVYRGRGGEISEIWVVEGDQQAADALMGGA